MATCIEKLARELTDNIFNPLAPDLSIEEHESLFREAPTAVRNEALDEAADEAAYVSTGFKDGGTFVERRIRALKLPSER